MSMQKWHFPGQRGGGRLQFSVQAPRVPPAEVEEPGACCPAAAGRCRAAAAVLTGATCDCAEEQRRGCGSVGCLHRGRCRS